MRCFTHLRCFACLRCLGCLNWFGCFRCLAHWSYFACFRVTLVAWGAWIEIWNLWEFRSTTWWWTKSWPKKTILKNDGIIRLSLILFSGYRFFKFMLFLAGFLVAFVLTYLLCSAYLTNELSGNALKHKEQVCNCYLNVHSLSSHSLSLCLWK